MSANLHALAAGLRRTLSWSNTPQAWGERLAALLLFGGAVGLVWYHQTLTLSEEFVLWAVLGLTAALFLRRGWVRFLGPMLFYDLLRVARRERYIALRTLYVLFLFLLLGWGYLTFSLDRPDRSGPSTATEMARFAERFFYYFFFVQLGVVAFLTPAYTAGAVAEEKERRTLEFILATDLRSREVVLSKLLSRFANLVLLVLGSLPLLSFLQFAGGIDPNLVLAGYAATILTVASLASLSILCSVQVRKARDAIALTYLTAAAYLTLSGAAWFLLSPGLGLATFPSTDTWKSPLTLEQCVEGLSAGNVVAATVHIVNAVDANKRLDVVLPPLLRDYAVFHGGVIVVCALVAVMRLRPVALREAARSTGRRFRLFSRRPRVGEYPMVWKEVFTEPGLRFSPGGRVLVALLVVASFVPLVFIILYNLYENVIDYLNIWVRIAGMLVACLMLVAVGARAAGSVGGERDRQTLDSLLTSPLENDAILFGKWVGNIFSVRWAWLWLGAIWGLGVVTGGLAPAAVLPLLVAWFVYAAALSGIGVFYSVTCRTTLRATVWTLVTAFMGGVGHWFLLACCLPFYLAGVGASGASEALFGFMIGFTPPLVLSFSLPVRSTGFEGRSSGGSFEYYGYAFAGIFCWAVIAAVVWALALNRFGRMAGRGPFERVGKEPTKPPAPAAAPATGPTP